MSKPRKILLAGASDYLRGLVDGAADEFPDVELEVFPSAQPQALNGKAVACDVLVVEVDGSDLTESALRVFNVTPQRKVIAAARNADPEDVRRMFRAGAADVLTSPYSQEALRAAFAEIFRQNQQEEASGRVVSIIGASGGAGVTTVALNLAAMAGSLQTKRRSPARTNAAVLDLDLQFGDADLALNLEPRSTVIDLLQAEQRFDGHFLEGAMTEHSSGLKLLAAPSKVVPMDALSPAFASKIVAQSAKLHPYTFVDLPHSVTDWSLAILRESSLLVLVAPATVQGAVGARRLLQAMEEAHVSTPVLFVLNKVAGMVDAFEKPARISKTLNRAVDAVLTLDPTAGRAFDRGVLLAEAFPKAKITRELRALASKIEPAFSKAESGQHVLTGVAA